MFGSQIAPGRRWLVKQKHRSAISIWVVTTVNTYSPIKVRQGGASGDKPPQKFWIATKLGQLCGATSLENEQTSLITHTQRINRQPVRTINRFYQSLVAELDTRENVTDIGMSQPRVCHTLEGTGYYSFTSPTLLLCICAAKRLQVWHKMKDF